MAVDLETELRSAVKNGFLHFSLSRVWKGDVWECSYKVTDTVTTHYVRDPDPVEALRKALRSGTREVKALPPKRETKRQIEDLA